MLNTDISGAELPELMGQHGSTNDELKCLNMSGETPGSNFITGFKGKEATVIYHCYFLKMPSFFFFLHRLTNIK